MSIPCYRRKEREMKRLESGDKASKSKKKGQKKNSSKSPKTASTSKSDTEGDVDEPDTTGDFAIAQELGLGRAAKTPSGAETKRQAALAQLRKDRTVNKNDSESELDYGSEASDEEFIEKPWNKPYKAKRGFGNEYLSDDADDVGGRSSQKSFIEADLKDFLKVTIPRRRLSRWCNEPYFDKAVMNFYVRLAIGRDKATAKPCYRLCKIVGVKVGKEYKFPSYSGQKQVS